ncbi:MAG TPA: multiheme c-type cytochrome [Hanamia sp.]
MYNKRSILFTGIITLCIIVFNRCINDTPQKKVIITNPNGQEYAGSESCRTCHQAIYDSFSTTMHHLTSGIAFKDYIKGSFKKNENTFEYNDSMKVVMEERKGGLFQAEYINGKAEEAERFDIVIGSGKKGQTYLYWKHNELYQLPVSYFAGVHHWANSPGYPSDKILFSRFIEPRCMECHTTFESDNSLHGDFIPKQIIYGVDCERCHGPGEKHVEFQEANPKAKLARFIINPASLSRQQSLDACALCHSGTMLSMKPSFSFLPGDTLSKYFIKNSARIDSFNLDVHANQYGLLTASKCFRISGTMTCSTCHNTHVKEDGNLITYAQKCMSCHTRPNHSAATLHDKTPSFMMANCINCHMPVSASKNLTLLVSDDSIPSPELVRSHLIGIYSSEKINKFLRTNR